MASGLVSESSLGVGKVPVRTRIERVRAAKAANMVAQPQDLTAKGTGTPQETILSKKLIKLARRKTLRARLQEAQTEVKSLEIFPEYFLS